MDLRWHTVPVEALIWRELEGELVVRNAMTGSTHLLESPAAEIFKALMVAAEGMTAADLALKIGEEGSVAAMEALLREFQRLGLAEPVD